jgi:hypothetical protein
MAIGDTVQAGLMRVDFSPFLEAGRANAAANASFGQALGQVAKGYIEGQEKKKRANEIAGFLMGQGVGEKDAQAIAKNPFLQKEYQRGQEAKAKMKMERERLATQANIAAQGRAARQAEIDQKYEREDADTQRLIGFSEDLISETTDPAVVQNADMARPGLFALGGDPEMRNRFLDAEIERQPKVTVGSLGSEDFATVARETGMDPRLSANRFMGLQKIEEAEELANQPKAMTPQELAEYEAKLIANETNRLKLNDLKNPPAPPAPPEPVYMESALDAIDDAVTLVDKDSMFNPTAGFGSETAKSIGGSDAADLEAALSTITSAVGFKRLQDMREASPTGGALGSVSERELSQLNAALGSISQKQSPEQLKKNLLKIKDHYQKAVDAINAQRIAYNSGLTFKTQEEALKYIQSQKSSNAITTDQGDYTIPGLSVEAQ